MQFWKTRFGELLVMDAEFRFHRPGGSLLDVVCRLVLGLEDASAKRSLHKVRSRLRAWQARARLLSARGGENRRILAGVEHYVMGNCSPVGFNYERRPLRATHVCGRWQICPWCYARKVSTLLVSVAECPPCVRDVRAVVRTDRCRDLVEARQQTALIIRELRCWRRSAKGREVRNWARLIHRWPVHSHRGWRVRSLILFTERAAWPLWGGDRFRFAPADWPVGVRSLCRALRYPWRQLRAAVEDQLDDLRARPIRMTACRGCFAANPGGDHESAGPSDLA